MFVTPKELAVMYQLWSLLSGKCHLESSALVKIRSFGLNPNFFDRKIHHLLHMNQFLMPSNMTLNAVPVQTLQTSFASLFPQKNFSVGSERVIGS
jgi:hypothetical protein